MNEELLEPLLRRARVAKALPVIRRYPQCRLLDFGCGWGATLLKDVEPYISRGVGIDRKAPAVASDKLTTLRADLEAPLPFSPMRSTSSRCWPFSSISTTRCACSSR